MVKGEKPGFYIWFKTVDQMAEMSFEEKGRIYSAAEEYSRYGIDTTFEDRFLRSIWTRVKSDLDDDNTKYLEYARKQQEKGWISTFKRNYAPDNGIDPNDKEALEAYLEERRSTTVNHGQQPSTNTNINTSINISTNNNTNTNNNSKSKADKLPTRPKIPKHKHGEYNNVLLTDEELAKLKSEYPLDWEYKIDNLSEYIESTGRAYKSHYATIRKWAKKDSKGDNNGRVKEDRITGDWTDDDFKRIEGDWTKQKNNGGILSL